MYRGMVTLVEILTLVGRGDFLLWDQEVQWYPFLLTVSQNEQVQMSFIDRNCDNFNNNDHHHNNDNRRNEDRRHHGNDFRQPCKCLIEQGFCREEGRCKFPHLILWQNERGGVKEGKRERYRERKYESPSL